MKRSHIHLHGMSHPTGVRGLKSTGIPTPVGGPRRTPHGVRGLKSDQWQQVAESVCRTSHGVRGLKFQRHQRHDQRRQSHPSRGAWIEIPTGVVTETIRKVAPLTGCVD